MKIFTSAYSPINTKTPKGAAGIIRRNRLQSVSAGIALIALSVATLFVTGRSMQGFGAGQEQSFAFTHLFEAPVINTALALVAVLAAVSLLAYVLVTAARPLPVKVVILRLCNIALFAVIITALKSLILGLFARMLFAGDVDRFSLAKMGVDAASLVLGVVFTACIYLFIATSLREEKLEMAGFGKNFVVMFLWVASVSALKFLLFSVLDGLAGNLFDAAYLGLAHISLALLIALISALATIWFMALALSLREDVLAGKELAKEDLS